MNQIDKIKLKDYISSVCKNYMSENVKHLLKTLRDDTFGVGTYFECIEIYYNDRLYFEYMLDNEDNKNVMMALKVLEYAEIEKDISEKLESGIPVKFFVNMETFPTDEKHMIMINSNVVMKTHDDIDVSEPDILYTQLSMRSHWYEFSKAVKIHKKPFECDA